MPRLKKQYLKQGMETGIEEKQNNKSKGQRECISSKNQTQRLSMNTLQVVYMI